MTKPQPQLADQTVQLLTQHAWPGNVRELENCIEYAVLLCTGNLLLPEHLPQTLRLKAPPSLTITDDTRLKARIRQVERSVLLAALKQKSGNVCAVAREIGITPRMVHYKLKNLNIDPRQFSKRGSAARHLSAGASVHKSLNRALT